MQCVALQSRACHWRADLLDVLSGGGHVRDVLKRLQQLLQAPLVALHPLCRHAHLARVHQLIPAPNHLHNRPG